MPIRVLVVDDSMFMRKMIQRYIDEADGMIVAGTARNGEEAVQQVKQLRPDVVTLDIEMPVMNGLDALRQMMKECPVSVIMLSSLTRQGAEETIAALHAGAVDFIHKPSGALSVDIYKVKTELIEKIRAAADVRIHRLLRGGGAKAGIINPKIYADEGPIEQIVAVGTSTGGPQALQVVLENLSPEFRHPIVVVQHMPPKFTASLAERLNKTSAARVVEARHDERIRNGTVYIAPGDYHLNVIEKRGHYYIFLHQKPVAARHRPSVNELFASVSSLGKLKRHFVIMTGMGRDGAEEMARAKEAGAESTIAESQESCVVYGMPKAAIELGAVDHIVPLEQIAWKLERVAKGSKGFTTQG